MKLSDSGLFQWFFTEAGGSVLAGALGGLVRWVTLREKPLDGLAAIIVGGVCALYLGPLIEPLLEPTIGKIAPDNDADGMASFLVGLGGISLTGFLIDLFRKGGGDEEAN